MVAEIKFAKTTKIGSENLGSLNFLLRRNYTNNIWHSKISQNPRKICKIDCKVNLGKKFIYNNFGADGTCFTSQNFIMCSIEKATSASASRSAIPPSRPHLRKGGSTICAQQRPMTKRTLTADCRANLKPPKWSPLQRGQALYNKTKVGIVCNGAGPT